MHTAHLTVLNVECYVVVTKNISQTVKLIYWKGERNFTLKRSWPTFICTQAGVLRRGVARYGELSQAHNSPIRMAWRAEPLTWYRMQQPLSWLARCSVQRAALWCVVHIPFYFNFISFYLNFIPYSSISCALKCMQLFIECKEEIQLYFKLQQWSSFLHSYILSYFHYSFVSFAYLVLRRLVSWASKGKYVI